MPLSEAMEPTLTTRPPPASAIRGMSARQRRYGATVLTCSTRRRSAVPVFWSGAETVMPALFTSTAGTGSASARACSALSSWARSERSQAIGRMRGTSSPASCRNPSRLSEVRASATTGHPARRKARAMALPMPRFAPVTTAPRRWKSLIVGRHPSRSGSQSGSVAESGRAMLHSQALRRVRRFQVLSHLVAGLTLTFLALSEEQSGGTVSWMAGIAAVLLLGLVGWERVQPGAQPPSAEVAAELFGIAVLVLGGLEKLRAGSRVLGVTYVGVAVLLGPRHRHEAAPARKGAAG